MGGGLLTWKGSLRGLSVGLEGGSMASMASRRVMPEILTSFFSTFLSMVHPLYLNKSNNIVNVSKWVN